MSSSAAHLCEAGGPRSTTPPSSSRSSAATPHRPPRMLKSSRKAVRKALEDPDRRPFPKPKDCHRARRWMACKGATRKRAPAAKRLPKAALISSSLRPPHNGTPSISRSTSPCLTSWPGSSSTPATKKPYSSASKSRPAPRSLSTRSSTSLHCAMSSALTTDTSGELSSPNCQSSLSSCDHPLLATAAYCPTNFEGFQRMDDVGADCSCTQYRCA
mmetsp:Transcript_24736/g.65778  ORF Transcript_24736/g.65778 Transcript_24736/m.65778 type:complete len:215 (-) Transcript_24736:755-1399(-)